MLRYGKKRIAAVGVMPFLAAGEHVALSGEWVEHRDYGAQIKVESYEVLRPKTKTAIERYLASGLIRGVGPKTAKLLVNISAKKRWKCSIARLSASVKCLASNSSGRK